MKLSSLAGVSLLSCALACGQATRRGAIDDGSGGASAAGGAPDGSSGGAPVGSGGQSSGGSPGSGGSSSGGAGSGGAPPLTACIECEVGFECFEEVAFDRCFKLCDTPTPNVDLYTQQDVADLAALECEVIGNDLSLASPDLTSLLGLETLRVIKGGFSISGTSALTSLDGLDGLLYIGDDIALNGNSGLVDISALSQMKTAEVSLSFAGNSALVSLDGLQSVKNVYSFMFTSNERLADVSGFSPETVSENVLVAGNGSVLGVAFPQLRSIGGSVQLTGEVVCKSLKMPALDYVGGTLLVSANPELEEVDVAGLTRVGGVTITENEALLTIGGLPALTDVDMTMAITRNPSLAQCEVDQIAARFPEACTYCVDNDPTALCE